MEKIINEKRPYKGKKTGPLRYAQKINILQKGWWKSFEGWKWFFTRGLSDMIFWKKNPQLVSDIDIGVEVNDFLDNRKFTIKGKLYSGEHEPDRSPLPLSQKINPWDSYWAVFELDKNTKKLAYFNTENFYPLNKKNDLS